MYNYNRDVAQAEQERFERMKTARQRQVPYHMRRDGFQQARGWLSEHVGAPIGTAWAGYYGRASRRAGILYRRSTTRAAGLVLNTLEGLLDMAPGRA